jgi:hypothetical protein
MDSRRGLVSALSACSKSLQREGQRMTVPEESVPAPSPLGGRVQRKEKIFSEFLLTRLGRTLLIARKTSR